ncbi:MAG: transcriptional regulator [Capsulimonas sp.]|nr:transcriptional regulator [Capsulimonas sp.]
MTPYPVSSEDRDAFVQSLQMLTGRWKVEILWMLSGGVLRFGELRRALPGITQHMLTTQLRELEAHGLVKRTPYAEVPPRVEYEMTDAARDLKPVFKAVMVWAREHSYLLSGGDAAPDGETHP